MGFLFMVPRAVYPCGCLMTIKKDEEELEKDEKKLKEMREKAKESRREGAM